MKITTVFLRMVILGNELFGVKKKVKRRELL